MSSDGPSTPPDLRLLITPHRTPVLDSAPPPQAPWPCCDFTPRDGPWPSRSPPSRPPARLCSALTFRLRSTSPELLGAPNRQFKHAEAPGPCPPSGLFGPAAAPRSLRPAWIPGHWRLFLLRSILFLCSLPPYSLEPVLILPSPCQHPAPAGPRGLSVSAACQHPEATGARPCPSPRPLGR